MHKLSVQQQPTRKLLGAVIAAALFLPGTGYALGLGAIEVNSALNQKLNADIQLLSASPEEAESLIVKLASREEFSRAGLDRPFMLNDLIFKSVEINGTPYIRVSSSSPIREPFLNFLVEIDWPNGRLLREYTVLLDPPVFMTQPASAAANNATSTSNDSGFRPVSAGNINNVPVAAPTVSVFSRPALTAQPATTPAQRPVLQNETVTQVNRASTPVLQQHSATNQVAGNYKVKTGDTAWSLADALRPDQSITVDQMMIAMLRENREAFINENINGLKRGHILRVPDYDQITSISHADAVVMVREQTALWRQYQQAQAGNQPVSPLPADDDGVSADMAGDSVADRQAGSEDGAYLEIVSAGTGQTTTGGKDPVEMTAQELRAELALAREKVETERVEKEALQQRIDSLQQNAEKMKAMLSIEDAELAGMQSLNVAEGEVTEAVIDEAVVDGDDIGAIDEVDIESVIDEAGASENAMAEQAVEEGVSDDALFVDEAQLDESLAEDESVAEQAAPITNDFVAEPPQIVNREPADPLSQLLSNPMLLAAAGGGLLFFVALIGLIIKRRKAAAAPAATMSGFDDLEILADDIASEADKTEKTETAPAVDESATDETDSTAAMPRDSAEEPAVDQTEGSDEEPRDDVIAEADVYLAYGIYQQAEELLTQAIADNPERDDYRLKLAETHYASKNADAFVDIASDIKQRVDDESSPVWKKVLGMGQDLCADNPLFKSAIVGGLVADSLSADSSEADFDLAVDEIADTMAEDSPVSGSSLDQEPVELPELEIEAEVAFDLDDVGAIEEPANAEDEFTLDIDASELDIDAPEKVDVEAESIDLSDEIEESLDLTDIDIGLAEEETGEVNASAVDEDLVATGIVEDATDIDFDVDDNADLEAMGTDEDLVIDLSEDAELLAIDLSDNPDADVPDEADVDKESATAEADVVAGDDLGDEEEFDLSKLDDVDEISTKLDLARAYLDMGDHEGTKGILEEVLTGGNDEQKQEANELMKKIS